MVTSGLTATSSPPACLVSRIYLRPHLRLERPSSRVAHLRVRVPPSVVTLHRQYRNISLLSIVYAFRPRLRLRLTLGGLAFPRNPWAFGEGDSHPFYRYSCRHNHFRFVHESFPSRFNRKRNAPLPLHPTRRSGAIRSFGDSLESRQFSAHDCSTSKRLSTF